MGLQGSAAFSWLRAGQCSSAPIHRQQQVVSFVLGWKGSAEAGGKGSFAERLLQKKGKWEKEGGELGRHQETEPPCLPLRASDSLSPGLHPRTRNERRNVRIREEERWPLSLGRVIEKAI